MQASIVNFLGHGCYTAVDAARYARVSPQLMGRWLFGPDAVLDRQIDAGDERIVSFVDFVQALTLRRIRSATQFAISMRRVRRAIDVLEGEHGIAFPFARAHALYEFDGDIVYQPKEGSPLFVSGRQTNQYLHRRIVEPHLKRLTFDDASGLATTFNVHNEGSIPIMMKARVRFGDPMLPSGYTAETLHDAVLAEGGVARAAEAFEVPPDEVEAAFVYWDSLFTSAARN